jgi:hypothetical protein
MRTLKEINLIWKHTHPDYRGINDRGVKCIMFLCPTRGATTSGAIETLPEKAWNDCLAYAQKKEAKKRFSMD